MSLVFLLLLIAMSGVFIAANRTEVADWSRAAGDWLTSWVQAAPEEVPVVQPERQNWPR